jgi:hypothetical protein
MKTLSLIVLLLSISKVHLFADKDIKSVLEKAIDETPARMAIWIDQYLPSYGYADVPSFSPVLIRTGDAETFDIAESGLFLLEPGQAKVSYYFVVVGIPSDSYEVFPASKSGVKYLLNESKGFTQDEIRSRLRLAGTLVGEYDHSMSELGTSPLIISGLSEGLFGYLLVATLAGQGRMSEHERLFAGVFWGVSLALSTNWLVNNFFAYRRNKQELERIIEQIELLWN